MRPEAYAVQDIYAIRICSKYVVYLLEAYNVENKNPLLKIELFDVVLVCNTYVLFDRCRGFMIILLQMSDSTSSRSNYVESRDGPVRFECARSCLVLMSL